MRTYSTPQSALDGEITKLAIIECILSAALYVGLGIYFGTFKYLAVAIVFAPLMLFRTDFSADWGMKLYGQFLDRVTQWDDSSIGAWLNLLALLSVIIVIPIVGTAIRLVATVYWAIRRPLHTLSDAPRNWLRQAFCTDFAHPPEIVPKESLEINSGFTFAEYWKIFNEVRGGERIFLLVLFSPFLIVGWIPAVVYRISFKATALVYVPFVWVAHVTLRNPLPVKTRLERFTKGELEKVRRGISYFVLVTLVLKWALVLNLIERGYIESKFPSHKIVTDFVMLDAWPWWQITFAADALLTFALLFFADAALSRIESGRPWREESVMTTVTSASFLRAAFGLVTISHFFYIALLAAAPNLMRRLLTP